MVSLSESLSYYLLNNSITVSRGKHSISFHGKTCLAVIGYAMKFRSNFASYMTLHLDGYTQKRALKFKSAKEIRNFIAEFFKQSFVPKAYEFFQVPKVHDLLLSEKKEYEILAGFFDFLLQVLNCEANTDPDKKQRYALLQKELTYLLSFLGDTLIQYCTTTTTDHEVLNNLFGEFQSVANEAGDFIYSCIFVVPPISTNRFDARSGALFEKVQHLNALIKEHCTIYSSELTTPTPRTDAIDSLFIVDSLLEDLENVIQSRSNLNMIEIQIQSLHQELTRSQTFLKKGIQLTIISSRAEEDHDKNEVKEFITKLRDAAYEAEYLVISHVAGNVPDWYLNLRLPNLIQKIKVVGARLHETNNKVHDSEKLADDFSAQVEVVTLQEIQPTVPHDTLVVGIKKNKTILLNDLLGGSDKLEIIFLSGMPGVGKTTLANKLYSDSLIVKHFDRRVFCVVSQEYQKKKVLVDILTCLSGDQEKDMILEMDYGTLALKIKQALAACRYLIILDDVWDKKPWDDLDAYFPDSGKGSRIMLTSRNEKSAPPRNIFRPIPLLPKDKCWKLLKMKVFHGQPCPPILKDIGERIAEKCNGLPLAIVVIAGVLANLVKEKNAWDWEEVERNLTSYIFDDPESCMKLLELSYQNLPDHLKPCFLYLAKYPEDSEIPTGKLKWLWIAEGFVKKEEQQSPEHVAEQYLHELINRSLLLIAETRSDGGIKSCRIHDLLRDMCLRKAHKECFLKSIYDYDSCSTYEKHHRLCVWKSKSRYRRPFGLHCRSFSGHFKDAFSCFPQMPLLRVMDLLTTESLLYMMNSMHLPVNLRYSGIDRMPDPVVGNYANLEFLSIRPGHSRMKIGIPSYILKMVKLRHLQIITQGIFEDKDEWDLDCKQSNLKSFSYVCINNQRDVEILGCWPHLAKLKCICNGELFPDLRSFTVLESLKMVFEVRFGELEKIKFPSTIKKLNLSGLGLPWEEMSKVGELPNLNVLKLLRGAFVGEKWETKDDEFKRLKFLKLDGIELNQWVTENSEHFRGLQVLVLKNCDSTQLEIPTEIGNIPTLQRIELWHCSKMISNSASLIKKEQVENGVQNLEVLVGGTSY